MDSVDHESGCPEFVDPASETGMMLDVAQHLQFRFGPIEQAQQISR